MAAIGIGIFHVFPAFGPFPSNSKLTDSPWMDSMSSNIDLKDGTAPGEVPTVAAFAPASSTTSYTPHQRNTIIVHQKSPLLLATPPQITRALAYSHIFIAPLNKLVGLVSWTSGDPWESFLLLASFCGATLYGDVLVRWTGPLLVVAVLVLGMYARRFSPLSSTGLASEQNAKSHQRKDSDSKTRHHKSLDEIVETLKTFTARCNILLEPFLYLTDFLSTQSTATSATTRPALLTLFIRILLLSPAWFLLSIPFVHIITTQRVVLFIGAIALSYHSVPARITRTILWRSLTVRYFCSIITGLQFSGSSDVSSLKFPRTKEGKIARGASTIATLLAASRKKKPSDKESTSESKHEEIRFTFTLYENQRRWIGIGWTASMLAYERTPWTDDQVNSAPSKDRFELPEVDGGFAKWQWCEDSAWEVSLIDEDVAEVDNVKVTATKASKDAKGRESIDNFGWIYYDTAWHFGRRQDGWGRYTRRRKWCRDAKLVEISPANTPHLTTTDTTIFNPTSTTTMSSTDRKSRHATGDTNTTSPTAKKRPWFGTASRANSKTDVNAHTRTTAKVSGQPSSLGTEVDGTDKESIGSQSYSISGARDDSDEDDGYVPMAHQLSGGVTEAAWGFGEDVGMELG